MSDEEVIKRLDTMIAILRLAHDEPIAATRKRILENDDNAAILEATASDFVQSGALKAAVKKATKTTSSDKTLERRIGELLALGALEKRSTGYPAYKATGLSSAWPRIQRSGAALLAKLGISKQQLSNLVQKRKSLVPMTSEHAAYTIAFDHGIDISKHLSPDEMTTVRGLPANVAALTPTTRERATARVAKASSKPKSTLITIAGVNADALPGMTAAHAREAKMMAEKVYPILYVFENSVRDLIASVLASKVGANWWDTVPKKVAENAARIRESEKSDPWHKHRGNRDLDYLLLSELWLIIKHHWPHFSEYFPDQAWVQTLITKDMNISRRAVAHMNSLAPEEVQMIETASEVVEAVDGKRTSSGILTVGQHMLPLRGADRHVVEHRRAVPGREDERGDPGPGSVPLLL